MVVPRPDAPAAHHPADRPVLRRRRRRGRRRRADRPQPPPRLGVTPETVMRTAFLAPACLLFLGLCAYLASQPAADSVKVRLTLADAETGKGVGGMVRVFAEGK